MRFTLTGNRCFWKPCIHIAFLSPATSGIQDGQIPPHRLREIKVSVPPENNTGHLFLFYSAKNSRCWDICQIILQKNCSHAGPRWHLATVAIRTYSPKAFSGTRLSPQSCQKIHTVFYSLCCLVMFPEFLISIVVWLPVAYNGPSRKT